VDKDGRTTAQEPSSSGHTPTNTSPDRTTTMVCGELSELVPSASTGTTCATLQIPDGATQSSISTMSFTETTVRERTRGEINSRISPSPFLPTTDGTSTLMENVDTTDMP
jgi:hypothetical protein